MEPLEDGLRLRVPVGDPKGVGSVKNDARLDPAEIQRRLDKGDIPFENGWSQERTDLLRSWLTEG
jgi:hypothetical protein